MLKNPLLSGWFRKRPFLNSFVVTTLISPMVLIFVQSTLAEQSKLAKTASGMEKTDLVAHNSALQANNSQAKLAEKIPEPEIHSSVPIEAKASSTPPMVEIPIDEIHKDSEELPEDPVGSPHPIPWRWIIMTQAATGTQGGSSLKQYRSLPVVSPDGQYSVYSRVQMEVKPEMYNSRVTSVLFIQNKQTGRLKVLTATSPLNDPLLHRQPVLLEQPNAYGTIAVLVPVSWSQQSDRFLARKFIGLFNTADFTDYAVIWDRQQNQINTVTPVYSDNDHEKIAVLLGWSKRQPHNVLFRAGELGEEHWPLLEVTSDGKTMATASDRDQPVTFGQRNAQIWVQPQVAYR